MRPFQEWWKRAKTPERAALVAATKLSAQFFRRLVSDDAEYSRNASSSSAAAIEEAANEIRNASQEARDRLPELSRADLSTTCAQCSYARQCVRSALTDFDLAN